MNLFPASVFRFIRSDRPYFPLVGMRDENESFAAGLSPGVEQNQVQDSFWKRIGRPSSDEIPGIDGYDCRADSAYVSHESHRIACRSGSGGDLVSYFPRGLGDDDGISILFYGG